MIVPISSAKQAQPKPPPTPPAPIFQMMAAAQMHSEGRLIQPPAKADPNVRS